MKAIKYSIIAMAVGFGLSACTDLEEKTYDRIDASTYYQNEASVQGAVAASYHQTAQTLAGENFFHLSEYPADQITWRVWNGGLWGWDEAAKTVLSWQNWGTETPIIENAWREAWTGIGLTNLLLSDLKDLSAADLGMSEAALAQYVAEVRTLRAWNYVVHENLQLHSYRTRRVVLGLRERRCPAHAGQPRQPGHEPPAESPPAAQCRGVHRRGKV